MSSVRKNNPLRVSKMFYFSQIYTEVQNTQRPERWWPLPLPLPRREGAWSPRYPYWEDVGFVMPLISHDNSWKVLWTLYAEGVLWVRNSAQMGSVISVSSVRERNTLCEKKEYPPWEKRISSMREGTPQRITCVSSHSEGAFYFSQSNTEEQNTQGFTETLSQPITQSVTANVSWKASVTSVCRRPSVGSKRAQKGSVNSVDSVREKNVHELNRAQKCSVKSVSSVRDKTPQQVS